MSTPARLQARNPRGPAQEVQFLKDAVRLLQDDVGTTRLSRGWEVKDLDVDDCDISAAI